MTIVEEPERLPTTGRRELVTIMVPVYNEERNIAPLVDRVSKGVSGISDFQFEILFVDDGSTDHTLQIIEQLSNRPVPVGCISLSRNFGHLAALEAGLHHAQGNVVISMDGDLQHPPEMIPAMLREYIRGADVVQMQRFNVRSDFKGLLSVTFYTFFSWISPVAVVPNAADFRLMSRRILDEVNKISGRGKLLRALIPSLGHRQVYLPYIQEERKSEQPKYTFSASYELAMHTIFKFSAFPANALTFSGAIVFSAGLILFGMLAFEIIAASAGVVIFIILATLSGLILFSSGIICRYLYFILEQVRSDPSYTIRKIILPKS